MSLPLSNTEIIAYSAAALGAGTILYQQLIRRTNLLPPGPRPLPFIGNLLDLPKEDHWLVYQKWSEQYGSDVIYLKALGTGIIVVNSAEAAKNLLVRSGIYSERPRLPMMNELIGLFWHFGFMPQGDAWRIHRKIFTQEYNPAAVARYRPTVLKWTQTFLQNLLDTPEEFMTHTQHMESGIVLETTFGLQVQPSGQPDPFIGAAKQAVEAMTAAGLFGSYLVDYLPILKYIPTPFSAFKKQAKHWRVSVDIAAAVPFDIAKKAINANEAAPSVTSKLLENSDPLEETAIRQSAAAMFASGSAATVSALNSFFLAMTLYPDVQAKARQELDNVLEGRLPDFSDESSLPYITAIIKEVHRWNPVVPLAFPHKLTADDTYKNYHLPAGSVVILNAWAMLHDASIYGEDTSSFKPERFLTADGRINPDVKDPDAAFGFARRACPGKHLANESLFITIASTLAIFEITKTVDEKAGGVFEPAGTYTQGLLSYPNPFKCTIRPRSASVADLIRSASL